MLSVGLLEAFLMELLTNKKTIVYNRNYMKKKFHT